MQTAKEVVAMGAEAPWQPLLQDEQLAIGIQLT
jgi:hypothetical protein